ncbi:MAG: acetyl-CoA carboxylase biotin carboxylase subunit [Rhodobacterales bacterium]|nr:acetyl-CoA carboxylase biotin carboxylase subunit [Rhodobacterales bacterium]
MFRRILIANRGEVAARILRTCKSMGVQAVAVCSEADRDHSWLAAADDVVCLGPARAALSYLDIDALLQVAVSKGCSAVHPGWGFLAENDTFALRCAAAGLTFIGPSPNHLRNMGDKSLARKTMSELGMPVIPGTKDPLADVEAARIQAEIIGYPVLLKAVSGGGGRGMRVVRNSSEVAEAYTEASAESLSAFADGRLYLEKLIEGGRHIEVQVIADRFGNAMHLGERECSVQRRHQKVVEEAPSPGLSPAERARILPIVSDVISRSGYRNVGTVEMLMDAQGKLWFMEMNTRLQVEHSVTEEISGVDLVEWQLRVAANEALPMSQSEFSQSGHAIEFRINAEDPDQDFKPCPGRVSRLKFPQGEGIRIDTHLRSGDRIPPNYDSMVAKLIVSAPTREQALERARGALSATVVEGVKTNLGLHRRIANWDAFTSGNYNTHSLEQWLAGGV